METSLVIIDPKEFGLEEIQANQLTKGLSQILAEREILSKNYAEIIKLEINKENISIFRQARLNIRDNRTKGIENWHKVNKAYFLNGGRFIDAIKNKEVAENERMEANLLSNEQYFENIERERIQKLQEDRAAEMLKYEADFIPGNLGELTDQVWSNFILGTKTSWEQKKAAEKAAAEAEIARIDAEKAEQERIRVENEELQKELKAQQAKADAEAKKAADKLKAEQEASRIAAEKAAYERAKLEAELKAKADAEAKAKAEATAKAEAELVKGDIAKFGDLISDLENLKSKYTFKSATNRKKYADVAILLDKIINHIQK